MRNDNEIKTLVKFQVKEGQKVRNQPNLFQADLKDALIWESQGIGFIVNDSKPDTQEIEEVQKEIKINKKAVKNA